MAARLRAEGVLVSPLGPRVLRACTHLDLTRAEIDYAAQAIRSLAPLPNGQPIGAAGATEPARSAR